MRLFQPATFSTDWEIMIFDRQDRVVPTDKIMGLAGLLSREMGLPIQIDDNTLECAMGINSSYEQLRDRIIRVTDRAADLFGLYDLGLCPAASHPIEGLFNASHIHVGTVTDEVQAIRLENQLIPYVPVFAALAANSPLAGSRRGEYKSYRVRHWAHHCTFPASVRDPALSQERWGLDAGPKLRGASTVEVRITDAATSRQFLAELVTFVAAVLHTLGSQPAPPLPTAAEYQDAMVNRWVAARDGLQATLRWQGKLLPVTDIIEEMMDNAREALAGIGAKRSDLTTIESMLRKRVCQADFARDLAGRYSDDYMLASVYTKVMRHWDSFERFLETATPLDPIAPPDDEEILTIHRDQIGEASPLYVTRDTMGLPASAADALLGELIERGWVRRNEDPNRGTLLTRIA